MDVLHVGKSIKCRTKSMEANENWAFYYKCVCMLEHMFVFTLSLFFFVLSVFEFDSQSVYDKK
jgi:hypothetical protein